MRREKKEIIGAGTDTSCRAARRLSGSDFASFYSISNISTYVIRVSGKYQTFTLPAFGIVYNSDGRSPSQSADSKIRIQDDNGELSAGSVG